MPAPTTSLSLVRRAARIDERDLHSLSDAMLDFSGVPIRQAHTTVRGRVADGIGVLRSVHAVVRLAESDPDDANRRIRPWIQLRVRLPVGHLVIQRRVIVKVWMVDHL